MLATSVACRRGMRQFTVSELAAFDGADGRPAYVAYAGLVYDVSASFLWKGGRHQGPHLAGRDLTGELASAPHEADLLDSFPVVGRIAK